MTGWAPLHDESATSARRRQRAEEAGIALSRRADPTLWIVVAYVTAIIAMGAISAACAHLIYGIFDPEPFAPLADKRILANVRNDTAVRPFTDAVLHRRDGALYLARRGDLLHRFDLRTELWSEERFRQTARGVHGDLVLLGAGCGDAGQPSADTCAQPDVLWAL